MASQAAPMLVALIGLYALAAVDAVEICRVADLRLVTQTGEFFLAVIFLAMGVSTIVFVLMAFKAAHEKRKFYYAMVYVTAITSFSYYAMLSGQAWLITPNCRQLFFVRFLEWGATMPLLLCTLGFLAGVENVVNGALMGSNVLMIFAGFMASITGGHIKWMWFTIAILLFAPIVFVVLMVYGGMAARKHPSVPELYRKISMLSVIAWIVYPITYIFADGINAWSPNFSILVYGVMDLFSKVVYGFILLLSHEALDHACGVVPVYDVQPTHSHAEATPLRPYQKQGNDVPSYTLGSTQYTAPYATASVQSSYAPASRHAQYAPASVQSNQYGSTASQSQGVRESYV